MQATHRMRTRLTAVGAHLASPTAPAAAPEGRVIEKRVYYSPTKVSWIDIDPQDGHIYNYIWVVKSFEHAPVVFFLVW
jgi:hypothetical protein